MSITNSSTGSWISIRAEAARRPLRLTIAITFGGLPDGWSKSARAARAKTWIGIVGLVLVAPFSLAMAAALLRSAGFASVYDWLASSNVAILAVTVSLFVGIPIALITSAWRITRLGMRREAGQLEGLMAVELAPLHLLVVAAALVCGGLFVGHLAADAVGCLNGVRSAC